LHYVNGKNGVKDFDGPVEHAKRCGDQDRVVNLHVCRAGRAAYGDVLCGDVMPALLYRRRDGEQGFQLG